MDYLPLSDTDLFRGVRSDEAERMLSCLRYHSQSYKKGEVIFSCGTLVSDIGLVLTGLVQIESTDLQGDKSILSVMGPGEVFAEAYACMHNIPLMADIIAREDSRLLLIDAAQLLNPCQEPCLCHTELIKNLLCISVRRNLSLSNRILDTAARNIRGRIISYFSREVIQQGSDTITLPFNRQQLADYLGVDRSALSRELGKMREDGLVDFDRNHRNSFTCHLGSM